MFSAQDVKKLREQTGVGMMACKNALSECQGDFDAAVDYLRKKGLAAAQKKQDRIAAEGHVVCLVEGNIGVLVEVNCETDFVSKGDDFKEFVHDVASTIVRERPADLKGLENFTRERVNELTLKVGEKIAVRRFQVMEAASAIGSYNHGGRIGVLVNIQSDTDASNEEFQRLIKDVSMHIAATGPKFVSASDIDEEFRTKEAEIYAAQLQEEGKPENMIGKIVEGKLRKLATEVCLLEQKFVKDPDMSVGKLLKNFGHQTKVVNFQKFNLGEGIERKEDNFVEEISKMTGQ